MDEDMEKLMGFHDQKKEKEPIDKVQQLKIKYL